MIFFVISLFSKSKHFITLLSLLESFYVIHYIFVSYFGDYVSHVDIYLFFDHISETFETLVFMFETILYPLFGAILLLFIVNFLKPKKSEISIFLLSAYLLFSFVFFEKFYDASLLLFTQSLKAVFTKPVIQTNEPCLFKNTKPLYETDHNIILVIGESMRSKEHLEQKYEIFEKYNYKTIVSGATNTDVSVPLLINGGMSPQQINLQNNLFLLAKKNGYKTHFISSQSQKSLKYIEPYLQKSLVDNYFVLGSRDDSSLVASFQNMPLDGKNFVVLQMQGEHSPYIYYKNCDKSDSIQNRYHKSMQYSNGVLKQLITLVEKKSKKSFIFLFTSDHGELLGEGNKSGHNRFDEKIYFVPFIAHSNLPINIDSIRCHGDLYELIYHYLGYSKEMGARSAIRVYGTMMTQEDGFVDIVPKY